MFGIKKLSEHNISVIKNIIGSLFVKGWSLIISVLLLPAYINFFQNETILGVWYTILSVLNWMNLFDLGLGNGLRNKLPGVLYNGDSLKVQQYISTTYIIMSFVSVLVMILGFFMIPLINWNSVFSVENSVVSNSDLIYCVRVIFCGIMIYLVLKIITSILYAIQKSAFVNFLSLISNIIILISVYMLPSRNIADNLKMMSWINVLASNLPCLFATFIVFTTALKDSVPKIKFFKKNYIKEILEIGVSLLFLQLVFMVISSTNELLITNFTEPENVVEYQAYSKIFHTGSTLFSLALIPIWSAVTKAQAQKDYTWIKKIYKFFLLAILGCFVVELAIIPILQFAMDIWLGKNVVTVVTGYAVIFAISSTLMILHNVNTSIGNGLSYFKIQLIFMTFAAVLFIPLSYIFVVLFDSWIGIIVSSIVCLLPYEIVAPISTISMLNMKISTKT